MNDFATLQGDVLPAVSAAQMREIDRIAVEESGPGLLQMMENAGRSMAVVVIKSLGERSTARVLVVAGGGGNGGGGLCAARHLAPRVGAVDVTLVEPDRLSPAAATQLRTYRSTRGREVPLASLDNQPPYDLVVDAVIGYGLRAAPTGPARTAIAWMARAGHTVVSLDVPSGLDPDTGLAPGLSVAPRLTLTLHLPKPGLANLAAGELYVADLGIPDEVTRRVGVTPPRYGPAFATPLLRV